MTLSVVSTRHLYDPEVPTSVQRTLRTQLQAARLIITQQDLFAVTACYSNIHIGSLTNPPPHTHTPIYSSEHQDNQDVSESLPPLILFCPPSSSSSLSPSSSSSSVSSASDSASESLAGCERGGRNWVTMTHFSSVSCGALQADEMRKVRTGPEKSRSNSKLYHQ